MVTFELCAYNIFTLQGLGELGEDDIPEDVLMVNDDVVRGVLCCNFFTCQGENIMLPDKH